jgi:hypothetical protein
MDHRLLKLLLSLDLAVPTAERSAQDEACSCASSSGDAFFPCGSWHDDPVASDIHCKRISRMGFQVVSRNGHRADVHPCQNVSISTVRKSVVDRTAIMQVPDKDGDIVVGIGPGVAASAGAE